jgi:hypothetical protein
MTIRDGNWELHDWDATSGRTVWRLEQDGFTHFRTDYPVENLIGINQEQRNISKAGWGGDYHHVASIPLNVLHDSGLVTAHSQGDEKFVSRWLNDSDNAAWRTKEGRV